jgi:hypothetical protein
MAAVARSRLFKNAVGGDQLGDPVRGEPLGNEVEQLARRHRIEFDPLMLQESNLLSGRTVPP